MNYTPADRGSGIHKITATYSGDGNFVGSSGQQDVTVNRATPTLSVTNSPVTYDGQSHPAAVSGSVAGAVSNVRYDGSPTKPTNAGTYAVTADFTPTDTTNYNSLVGASAGNFVIQKATLSLYVGNWGEYNGSPWTAVVKARRWPSWVEVPGVASNIRYNGSTTPPTNAGTYAVVADFTPTDTANYNSPVDAPAGNFVIYKAWPTLAVTNSPVTYNGTPQAATVTCSAPGVVSNVKYNGSLTEPTNAGTYAMTANCTPTDTANYYSPVDEPAGNFTIEKATPTLAVTNSPVVYNSLSQAAIVKGLVPWMDPLPGSVTNVRYDGLATEPTNAGTYAVVADFTPTDISNYNSLVDEPAGNFIIEKATPSLAVTNSPVVYNGLPKAAMVKVSVPWMDPLPGLFGICRYNGSPTVPTNAGTYAVTCDFTPTDITNYNNLVDAPAGDFIIQKATPVIAVTYGTAVYNSLPQAATIVSSVPGTFSNVRYNGSPDQPLNVGIYAVVADFTPTDTANYYNLVDEPAGNFIIEKATPSLAVTNSPVIYNGTPQAADIKGSVPWMDPLPGSITNVRYNGSLTIPTNAGTYAVVADFTPTDAANYNSLVDEPAGNFVIQKATPTCWVTNPPVVYNGSPQTVTVACSVPGNPIVIPSEVTNAGTYAVTVNFTPADTTNYNSLVGAPAGNFVIQKATPTLSVTNSPVVYNGSPWAAVVKGSVPWMDPLPGAVSNCRYDGSLIEPTNAGTYAVRCNFTPTDTANYYNLVGASAGNFEIQKATPTLSITNSPVTYNGTPQAAIVKASVPWLDPLPGTFSNVRYNGSLIEPTDAGTYAVTADFTPDDPGNYNSLVNGAAGDFVIDKATPTCWVTNSPVIYNGLPQAVLVDCSTAGAISNVKYNGSPIEPTNAATYAVTVDFAPIDTANYNSPVDAPAGDFTILKDTPWCWVTNSPVAYTGLPQAATVACSVPGLITVRPPVPINAGSYAVIVDFTPDDTVNYNPLVGTSAGLFIIEKATPRLAIANTPAVYTGSPQIATIVPSVPGVVSNIRYNGSPTPPTNIGIYAVVADFVPTDKANYNSLVNEPAGDFIIEPATPTLAVTNSPVTYNGLPQPAAIASSVTGVISNVRYNGSATVPTNAGTYAVTADFVPTDTTKYKSLSGGSAGVFVIQKVAPTCSVTNSPVVYSGSVQAVTVACSVPGAVSNVRYNGSTTLPTNADTYAITVNFTPSNPTNHSSLVDAPAGNFIVQKATPTLAVTNSPAAYNGSPRSAVVMGSVPGFSSNIRYNGSTTVPINVGSYAITADFIPVDGTNYNPLVNAPAGNFSILYKTYLPLILK